MELYDAVKELKWLDQRATSEKERRRRMESSDLFMMNICIKIVGGRAPRKPEYAGGQLVKNESLLSTFGVDSAPDRIRHVVTVGEFVWMKPTRVVHFVNPYSEELRARQDVALRQAS